MSYPLRIKYILTIISLSVLVFSCSKNDFENTNLYFEFDKETYLVNDNFQLTVRIVPIEGKKTIRLYKDLSNIEISFLSKAEQLGFDQELKKRFIEGPNSTGEDKESIDEFTISKENPFEKKFAGTISVSESEITFEISDLKIKDRIQKVNILENPTVLIKGNCRTVYGIEGGFFETKEIKISME